MSMTYWDAVASDLGISVVHPYQVKLDSHTILIADALFPSFGSERGMLVFHEQNVAEGHEAELLDAGFGYTCFSKMAADDYARDDAIEMLSDWGWAERRIPPPNWIK